MSDRERLSCACQSAHLDVLYAYVQQSDILVAKALTLSEVAQIAKAEVRLREYLLSKWRLRSREAASAAARVVGGGGAVERALAKVNSVMSLWSSDVEAPYAQSLARIYKLARVAGYKKATGKTKASLQYMLPEADVIKAAPARDKLADPATQISLDLQDSKAIAALQKQEMIWIGEHYGENVAAVVKEAVNAKMVSGLGREAAARIMRETVEEKLKTVGVPSGWRGTDSDYFEGLAANATTNARVQGQLESFSRVKVVTYEIVNPMDNRTTPFCNDMNGTLFSVQEGMGQLSSLRAAKTPEQFKAAAPWMSAKDASAIRAKGGSKALAKAGLALPPYHFRCRSTVDVASESTSYADLLDD